MLQEVRLRKEQMRDELPPEPMPDDPDAVRILLKLPNGCRLERRFNRHEPITVSSGQFQMDLGEMEGH